MFGCFDQGLNGGGGLGRWGCRSAMRCARRLWLLGVVEWILSHGWAYTEAFAGVNGIPLSGLISTDACVIDVLQSYGEGRGHCREDALHPTTSVHQIQQDKNYFRLPSILPSGSNKCTQDPALKPNAGIQPRWGASACRTRTFPSKPTRIISCQSN